MATLDPVNIGVVADDGLGDPLRTGFTKMNSNEAALNVELIAKTFANAVIVKTAADFPAPITGEINLVDNTTYVIDDAVTITDEIVPGIGNSITSLAANSNELNYTGTGIMFKGANTGLFVSSVALRCANGTLQGFTDTAPLKTSVIEFAGVIIRQCKHIGLLTDIKQIRYFACTYEDIITTGHTFSGNIEQIFSGDTDFVNNSATPIYDLGTVTADLIWVIDYQTTLANASGSFISGLADNGNLNVGGFGQAIIGLHLGPGTPFIGISPNDTEWNFKDINDVPDTNPDSLLSFSGNALATTINTLGVAEKVNAVWTINQTSIFSAVTNGRVTYDASRSIAGPIDVQIGLRSVSGNFDAKVDIAVNGTVVSVGVPVAITASKPTLATVIWQSTFAKDDFVEVFVTNLDGTQNIVVESATFRIR